MQRGLKAVLLIVLLDAMGIGIVFPTLPGLLRQLLHGGSNVALHYGYLLAAYAVTMFLASPLLGVLSDRFGRRPILLLSLFGTALDDMVMALAPTVSFLYLGRTLAGMTGANMSVANAYLSDVTLPEERSKAFGQVNASFGIGFIAGPLLGGLAGQFSLRAPFFLAAGLNLLGAVICFLLLRESRPESERRARVIRVRELNPFGAFQALGQLHGVGRLLYVFATMATVAQVPSVLWVLYGTEQFGWSPAAVGSSFAVFGAIHALFQATLPERAQRRLGREGTVLAGIVVDSAAYGIFSVVRSSVQAFATIPLLSLGGVAAPAVQSMLTTSVGEERQGQLQGVLTSITSLVAVVGPIAVSWVYTALRKALPGYPGAVWLLTVLLYVPSVAVLLSSQRPRRSAQSHP
jgi:MFS transporter, DHA1 family, tetracycline resistance protein